MYGPFELLEQLKREKELESELQAEKQKITAMKEVSTDDLIHKQEYMVLCNVHKHKQQLVKELESVHLELQTEKQKIEQVSTI